MADDNAGNTPQIISGVGLGVYIEYKLFDN
jgi:hypothetical protein